MKELIEKFQKAPVKEYNNKVNFEPLVSVCVQTYQHVDYIEDCLYGILMQKTNFPIEILLGEDESNDGTREICIDYAKKYPDKIRLFLHTRENNIKINGKQTGRFNLLYNLSKARGKYIALCEGDDYWTYTYKLQKQVEFLNENLKYSMCFHNAILKFENGKPDKLFNSKLDKQTFTIEDVISRNWFVPTQSMVYRKDIFERPEWIKYCYNGDYVLQLLLANKGNFYYINEPFSVYRKHSTSLSSSFNKISSVEKIVQILHFWDIHTGFEYHEIIERRTKLLGDVQYKKLLYARPFYIKLFSIDFYLFKVSTLFNISKKHLYNKK